MTVQILVGDCRPAMRMLPARSVHTFVTSIPYWGLRDYKIDPSVWGGDPACAHAWGDTVVLPLPTGDYPAIVRGRNRDRLDISIDYPGIELELTVPLYDKPREGCPRGSCYEV